MDYESGAWNLEWREKSSNCWEAKNLTDRLERLVADGALRNNEVFLITDNSAFEGAFYKGHYCVSGPQGSMGWGVCVTRHPHLWKTDEGLRGRRSVARRFNRRQMAGKDPLSFIPFNQGADDRAGGKVSAWVHSWWKTKKGMPFGGFPLRNITKDNMFELRDCSAHHINV